MDNFEKIYTLYFRDVYKYVFALCRDKDTAEEITQAAFCQAMEHMDSFRGTCKITVWLCQIAKHLYFAHVKKEKRKDPFPDNPDFVLCPSDKTFDSPEQQILRQEQGMEIHRHLHALPEPYKEVFLLRVFGDLSFQKIAMIFEKSESWARVTFHRARLKILKEMEDMP